MCCSAQFVLSLLCWLFLCWIVPFLFYFVSFCLVQLRLTFVFARFVLLWASFFVYLAFYSRLVVLLSQPVCSLTQFPKDVRGKQTHAASRSQTASAFREKRIIIKVLNGSLRFVCFAVQICVVRFICFAFSVCLSAPSIFFLRRTPAYKMFGGNHKHTGRGTKLTFIASRKTKKTQHVVGALFSFRFQCFLLVFVLFFLFRFGLFCVRCFHVALYCVLQRSQLPEKESARRETRAHGTQQFAKNRNILNMLRPRCFRCALDVLFQLSFCFLSAFCCFRFGVGAFVSRQVFFLYRDCCFLCSFSMPPKESARPETKAPSAQHFTETRNILEMLRARCFRFAFDAFVLLSFCLLFAFFAFVSRSVLSFSVVMVRLHCSQGRP
jgi:hypothetical protein